MGINEFKNIKILFVDDEDNIRENAVSYLKRLFDEVYEAKDSYEALEILQNNKPHIMITDINIPGINGIELIRKVRQNDENIKIIVLSAYTKTDYLLEAVELNLEKYFVKPVTHDRLFPVLSSCANKLKNKNLKYFSKDCYFDILNKTLYKDGNLIKISKKELEFLTLLCKNANSFVNYDLIQAIIWEDSFMSEDALKSLVTKIRAKLPINSLENFAKMGYKINTIN